jgi:methionyl aminopeptidase
LNDEVVHGFPRRKTIKSGDLVSLDLGIEYKGLFTDSSISFLATDDDEDLRSKDFQLKRKLIKTTLDCLRDSLNFCHPGCHLGDIGFAIQKRAEEAGFSVVRDLVGHGVGHAVHEDPFVLNYGRRGHGMKLSPGLVLAIEPMLNIGSFKVILDRETGWAYKTKDGSLSAHFEWTVAITEKKPKVLTSLDWFYLDEI